MFQQKKVYPNLQTAALILYYIAFSNKTVVSEAASRLAISLFSVYSPTLYFAPGLINTSWIFILSAQSTF
jgi:hypothetical protein